jgi:hypothetical protein
MGLEDEPIYAEPADADDVWPQDGGSASSGWPRGGGPGHADGPQDGGPGHAGGPQDDRPGHAGGPGHRGDRGAPGFSVRLAAAVAVVAAAVGVTAGLLLVQGKPIADGARQTATAPSASAPASAGGSGLPALPALSGQGDGQLQLMLTGRVLAISGTSITIGGNGPSVTAAITRSTKITGAVHGIGGVKAGAEVSAQVTGSSGHLTATAIQDPAVT